MANGRPIVIEFASDVRDFLKGTRKVERATEDIGDELKEAGKDSDRFEREFKQSMKGAEKQADRSARKIEQDFEKTPGKLGEVGEDAGGEFVQNIGEAVSSGDVEGLISGTLGGIVSGLKGPMGLAAAGLAGVAVLAFQKVQAEAERMQTWYDSWADGLIAAVTSTADQINVELAETQFQDWMVENIDSVARLDALWPVLGINGEAAFKSIFAGETDVLDALNDIIDAGTTYEDTARGTVPVYDDQARAAFEVQTEVLGISRSQQEAKEDAEALARALGKDGVGKSIADTRSAFADLAGDIRSTRLHTTLDIQTRLVGPGADAIRNGQSGPITLSRAAQNNPYNNRAR